MVFSPSEFRSFQLEKVERVNHNVSVFRFKLPNETDVAGLPVASCVVFRANVTKNGETKEVIRPYTPVSREQDKGFIDFAIKDYPHGNVSSHVHALKVGESIDIKGPFVKWDFDQKPLQHAGFVVAGTGITPALQILRKVFDKDAKDKISQYTLVFANIEEQDILFKNELDALAVAHPDRFKVHYVLERHGDQFRGSTGFVTKELLEKTLPKQEDAVIFVCGPPPFMTAVSGDKNPDKSQGELSGFLKELGYPQERVYKL